MKDPRGRKPLADKKKVVNLFIQESIIQKWGGLEKLKEILVQYAYNPPPNPNI